MKDMKELLKDYEEIYKKKWENAKRRKVEVFMIVWVLVVAAFMCYCMNTEKVTYGAISAVVFLLSACVCIYVMQYKFSGIFEREEILSPDWQQKFSEFLTDHDITTEEDIRKLKEWCDTVVGFKFPNDELKIRIEKALSIFVVPAGITIMFSYAYNSEINALLLLICAMIGFLIYVILPSCFKRNERYLIDQMRLDLVEFMLKK